NDLHPVPPMEADLLPAPLRAWLVDISERVGCPVEFPSAASIVALAAVVGRKVAIRPKRHDNWKVTPNVWGALVGRPGIMKTPALSEAVRMLHRLAKEAERRHAESLASYRAAALIGKA